MDPADLDRLLDHELKALPRPRAPRTLVPRVIAAALEQAGDASAATGWSTWSRAWQLGSAAALIATVLGIWWLLPAAPREITDATRTAAETATLVRVFWQVLFGPIAVYIAVLGVALTLACAAAWAAFEVALGGASHR